MKKIILVVIVVVILGALLFLMNLVSEEDDNMAIIQDAFYEDGSAQCTFVEPAAGEWPEQELLAQIKKGMVKISSRQEEEDYTVILKGNMAYLWNEYEATKFEIGEREIIEIPLFAHIGDRESFLQVEQEFKIDCQRIALDDDVFTIPENVEFEDFTNMIDPEGFEDIEFDAEDFEDMEFDLEDLDDIIVE